MQNRPTQHATISAANHQPPLDYNCTNLDHPLTKLELSAASKFNGGYSTKQEGGSGHE